MEWTAPEKELPDVATTGSEKDLLCGWLNFHRSVLVRKCSGLTAEQLKARPVPPSTLSLHGLVRHMTEVESSWFRRRVGGEDFDFLYSSEANPNGEFDDVDEADAKADFANYQAEIGRADAVLAHRSLDDTLFHTHRGVEMSVRWVYLHMIEEYARHNGHADLLRERIDGRTGD